MQIELWPLDRIVPYDKNPRLNDDAVDAVARSIQEFGFRQPIVVDDEGVIIIGHTRFARRSRTATDGHTFALGATESPSEHRWRVDVATNPQENRTSPDGRKKVSR